MEISVLGGGGLSSLKGAGPALLCRWLLRHLRDFLCSGEVDDQQPVMNESPGAAELLALPSVPDT